MWKAIQTSFRAETGQNTSARLNVPQNFACRPSEQIAVSATPNP